MISKETLTAIHPIVEQLCAANYGVRARSDSIVAALDNAAFTPLIDTYHDETGFEEAWLHSLSRAPVFGTTQPMAIDSDGETLVTISTSMHGHTLDEASKVISGSVLSALTHARNVANPTIKSMIDNVTERMEDAATIKEPFEIVDVRDNEAWSSPILLAALENFHGYNRPKIVERSEIPRIKVDADWGAELRTGSDRTDKQIAMLLKETDQTMKDVFDSIFNTYDDAGKFPARAFLSKDLTLLKFLLCNMLIENPVEGSGMNGTSWKTLLTNLSIAYGSCCRIMHENTKRDTEMKRLMLDADRIEGKIWVDGSVYDSWLDAGGTPELLIGTFMNMSSYTDMSYDKLLENKDIGLRQWTAYHTAQKNAEDANRKVRQKRALLDSLLVEIEALDPELYPPLADKSHMVSRAQDQIEKLTTSDLADMGKVAQKLVCNVMFFHTPAFFLLDGIGAKIDDGYPAEEAASSMAIEYIADWVIGSLLLAQVGTSLQKSDDRRNMITLANTIEVITVASMEVLGSGKTSKNIDGEKFTRQTIADAAAAQVRSRLVTTLGA